MHLVLTIVIQQRGDISILVTACISISDVHLYEYLTCKIENVEVVKKCIKRLD